MCEISNELSKVKTGYKIVAVKNRRIYSTFTRQEYKVGKVPLPPKKQNPLTTAFVSSNNLKNAYYYNHNFAGKTACYTNLYDAIGELPFQKNEKTNAKYKFKIAKISFRGDVYKGVYKGSYIIAGDTIRSIKIID